MVGANPTISAPRNLDARARSAGRAMRRRAHTTHNARALVRKRATQYAPLAASRVSGPTHGAFAGRMGSSHTATTLTANATVPTTHATREPQRSIRSRRV